MVEACAAGGGAVTDRYTAQQPPPRLWAEDWYGWVSPPSTVQVHEDDTPVFTGLLDREGNRLYRVRDRQPLGFAR